MVYDNYRRRRMRRVGRLTRVAESQIVSVMQIDESLAAREIHERELEIPLTHATDLPLAQTNTRSTHISISNIRSARLYVDVFAPPPYSPAHPPPPSYDSIFLDNRQIGPLFQQGGLLYHPRLPANEIGIPTSRIGRAANRLIQPISDVVRRFSQPAVIRHNAASETRQREAINGARHHGAELHIADNHNAILGSHFTEQNTASATNRVAAFAPFTTQFEIPFERPPPYDGL